MDIELALLTATALDQQWSRLCLNGQPDLAADVLGIVTRLRRRIDAALEGRVLSN